MTSFFLPLFFRNKEVGDYYDNKNNSYAYHMSIISGPFLCFECSKPKEIVMTIHKLYSDKRPQERMKKIKEISNKNAAAIDLGDSGSYKRDLVSRLYLQFS
jgi:hypothetical protein